ncbi:MAG: hypothetical protein VKK59_03940 [Vampirovibrionales bacterium]|nr:hypothetical protein [Vampirovibrionales bacterium]
MQIIFDSLDELESFVLRFQSPAIQGVTLPTLAPEKSKRSASPASLEISKLKVSTQAPKSGETLTLKVRKVIENFIKKGEPFSANSVYQALLKKDPLTKKESVIASVLKQMTSEFASVPFQFEKGKGPRNVKMYHPSQVAS